MNLKRFSVEISLNLRQFAVRERPPEIQEYKNYIYGDNLKGLINLEDEH